MHMFAFNFQTLMAEPGFWTLKPNWCKNWFSCPRLWKGSAALYIHGALEPRIIQTALLSGRTALWKCVSWSLGQIVFEEVYFTISTDILVMAKMLSCIEGLVMLLLFLCKCSSAEFLEGFLCLCVSGVSSWLGELCFPQGPYLLSCWSHCSWVQPTLKLKTKGLD